MIIQYIKEMVPFCVIGVIFWSIVRVTILRKKKFNPQRDILICLFVAYCFGLASQTILPRYVLGIDSASEKPFLDVYFTNENATVNFIPFKTVINQLLGENNLVANDDAIGVSLLNLMANIFLFLPLGIFIPLIYNKCESIRKVLLIGVIVSSFIEVIQIPIGRSCDVDDVILNTFGVIMGFAIFCIIKKLLCNVA